MNRKNFKYCIDSGSRLILKISDRCVCILIHMKCQSICLQGGFYLSINFLCGSTIGNGPEYGSSEFSEKQ